jgi:hypothetical protein
MRCASSCTSGIGEARHLLSFCAFAWTLWFCCRLLESSNIWVCIFSAHTNTWVNIDRLMEYNVPLVHAILKTQRLTQEALVLRFKKLLLSLSWKQNHSLNFSSSRIYGQKTLNEGRFYQIYHSPNFLQDTICFPEIVNIFFQKKKYIHRNYFWDWSNSLQIIHTSEGKLPLHVPLLRVIQCCHWEMCPRTSQPRWVQKVFTND